MTRCQWLESISSKCQIHVLSEVFLMHCVKSAHVLVLCVRGGRRLCVLALVNVHVGPKGVE